MMDGQVFEGIFFTAKKLRVSISKANPFRRSVIQ